MFTDYGYDLWWLVILNSAVFPVLIVVYLRLSHREERMMDAEFGDAYAADRRQIPGFVPRFGTVRAGTGQKLQGL